MNNNFTQFTFILLVLLFSMDFVNGQAAFTGSEVKMDITANKADAIFVGQIEKIGGPTLAAIGEKAYYGVEVKVVEVLKGTVNPEVSVALTARTDAKVPESAPEASKTYIFFVKKKETGSQFRVLKLLPADTALIAQVKALIAAQPATK
jgi:hypothetical protein